MFRTLPLRVIAAALLVGCAVIGGSLLGHEGDITGLVKFGSAPDAQPITEHVEAEMGREIATVDAEGHDGKYFYLQALDPLYLTPDRHAALLDRPVYRGQRMLFPLVAGAGGLVPPTALPWTMAITNLFAIALGTAATARLARRLGGSEWWGLAFALNVGIIFEFDISGAGILAFAAALWGTVALEERDDRRAAVWFTVAVLAREVMFLYLAGALLLRLVRTRRIPWLIGIPPTIAAGAWAVYLRLRLTSGSGVDEVQEFGPPFGGMAGAYENWIENPVDLAVILALIAIMPMLIVRAIRRPTYLTWGSLGFVVLAVFFSRQVWWRFFDISRAIAPVLTAYLVATFAAPDEQPSDDPTPTTAESTAAV
ncbi:MAG: hypothetical protein RIB98_00505 [Acidimicrobiales bacterium]